MEIIDDQPDETQPPHIENHELDAQKIHQLTALRRGAIRARSWCLITTALCLIAALQLILNTVQVVRREHSWGLRSTAYIVAAIGGGIIARFSIRRAITLKKEIDKPLLDAPKIPPDFSTLSNGSHRLHDLENIQ